MQHTDLAVVTAEVEPPAPVHISKRESISRPLTIQLGTGSGSASLSAPDTLAPVLPGGEGIRDSLSGIRTPVAVRAVRFPEAGLE